MSILNLIIANPENVKSALSVNSKKNEEDNEVEKIKSQSKSISSKKSSTRNIVVDSNLSEKSAFKRFNDLHEKIEKFALDFLEKLFECKDTRIMIRSRNESKKLANNFNQENLDFK